MSGPADIYQARVAAGDIKPDPHQETGIESLQRLYTQLCHPDDKPKGFRKFLVFFGRKPRNDSNKGVYLHGPVGRGKSLIMDLFHDSLPDDMPKRRAHFHAFMISVHDFLHQSRQALENRSGPDRALLDFAEKLAREVRVLCFDEFHVTDVADAMILSRLFTALLDKGIAVVMTSNWPPDRLYEGGLQRDRFLPFIALLKSRFDVVAIEGPLDYRLRLLEDNGVYHWPLGEGAHDWAHRLFKELSGGAPSEAAILEVKGRVVEVREAARGVARFTFAELCERPVGAEDYLTIARTYHTVFLEGVPKLRYDRRNEAKRLMTLVDALYDSGTRLVVTADAPPEKLYYGTDHAFEFQRTVSRLLEMQSNDWLEKTEMRQMTDTNRPGIV